MKEIENSLEVPPTLKKIALRKKRPSKKFFILLSLSISLFLVGSLLVIFLPEIEKLGKSKSALTSNFAPTSVQEPIKNSSMESGNSRVIGGTTGLAKESPPFSNPPNMVQKERRDKNLEAPSIAKTNPPSTQELQNTPKPDSPPNNLNSLPEPQRGNEEVSEKSTGSDFLFRAIDYEKKGQINEAISEYIDYINHTKKADPRILNKISTLYLMIGKLKEAEHYLELALKGAENSREILINYGVLKAKLGNLKESEEIFERVLKQEPNNRIALHNLALIKEKLGKSEEAIELFERLYRAGDKEALRHIERLRRKT